MSNFQIYLLKNTHTHTHTHTHIHGVVHKNQLIQNQFDKNKIRDKSFEYRFGKLKFDKITKSNHGKYWYVNERIIKVHLTL